MQRMSCRQSVAATIDQLNPHSESGAATYASMTHDLLAGLPLEADAVIGDIVQRAERRGIPVPCLRFARDLLWDSTLVSL